MNRSESIAELAAALAEAQGQMENAKKDADNPFFKSKYADLASVWAACRDALSANGLSVLQAPRSIEGGVEVETILMHSSGEWISETLALPVQKADAQGFGSALTYCRRYGLSAMIGIAAEDDDGNAAAKATSSDFKPGIQAKRDQPVIDRLRVDRQKLVRAIAAEALEEYKGGSLENTYAAIRDEGLSNDEMLALWGELKDAPTIRAELKRLNKAQDDKEWKEIGDQLKASLGLKPAPGSGVGKNGVIQP